MRAPLPLNCALRARLFSFTTLPLNGPGMLEAADADGTTVRQALQQAGFDPSPATLRNAAMQRKQVWCAA